MREDATSRVGRLSTCVEPIKGALEIQIYCGRIGIGVVGTNLLNKLAISWRSTVSNDDLVEGVSLTTMALQSNFLLPLLVIILFVARFIACERKVTYNIPILHTTPPRQVQPHQIPTRILMRLHGYTREANIPDRCQPPT